MKIPKAFLPKKNLEKNIATLLAKKEPMPNPIKGNNPVGLENIYCKDEYGNMMEHYDKIFIKTELATTNKNRSLSCFTLPGAVSFFERQKGDVFLPSCALTCNILAKLYELRHYEEMENLLLQYKTHGLNDGWHIQNTIVDWKRERIIHYPGYTDIPKKIKKRDMNFKRSGIILDFTLGNFEDGPLNFLLKDSGIRGFIEGLTGLEDPEVLIDIGDYFRKPTRVWFPNDPIKGKKPSIVWIGCRHDNFDIYLCGDVGYSGPARGVYINNVKKKK